MDSQIDARSIYAQPLASDPVTLQCLARTKRFLERYLMDGGFRAALARNPAQAAAACGLEADPERLRPLWAGKASTAVLADESAGNTEHWPIEFRRFRAFRLERAGLRDAGRAAIVPADDRIRSWRERQIRRLELELGPRKASTIPHVPVAYELSEGCTVGCWFCAAGAEPFAASWPHEPNAELWRDVLRAVRRLLGPAAARGSCYWATEPLDNPDYERFLGDFAEVNGRYPETTTAVPLRDLDRTRRLLTLTAGGTAKINRFSILSTSILDRVHDAFTAEELLFVDLVPVTPDSLVPKVFAGHARTARAPRGLLEPADQATTAACLSGFLISMPRRTVRLVTPCAANAGHPLGWRELGSATFTDGPDLGQRLEWLVERHMPRQLRVGDPVGLAWEAQSPGTVEGAAAPHEVPGETGHLGPVLAVLRCASVTPAEIAAQLEREANIPLAETFLQLDRLFAEGLLEPRPAVDA